MKPVRVPRLRERHPNPIGLTVLGLAIAVIGISKRWNGLRASGWHGDDAWIVNAVLHPDSLGEFIDVGFTHVGYNALLRLFTSGATPGWSFQLLSFVAGVAGLWLMHRITSEATGSSVLAFVALLPVAASRLQFRFSLAVKPYTIELLALAGALWWIHRRERPIDNRALATWSVLLLPATLMSFRLVFVSVAVAATLFLASQITIRRLVALGAAHVGISLSWLVFVQSLYDNAWLTQWWIDNEDAFATDPFDAVTDLPQRLHRVMRLMFIDWPTLRWLLVALLVVGIAESVMRRRRAGIAASIALGLSVAGSALQLVPFGTLRVDGERIDLWLTPAIVLLVALGAMAVARPIIDVVADGLPELKSAVSLALLTTVAALGLWLTLRGPDHRYPARADDGELEVAMELVRSRDMRITGAYETAYHLGARFPETLDGIEADASHPRGIRLLPRQQWFLTSNEVLEGRFDPSRAGVVVSTIAFRGPDYVDLVTYLEALGLAPADTPWMNDLEVWVPADEVAGFNLARPGS